MQTIKNKLPFWLKLLYGSGDWGLSSIGMMRSIFYALYLTDVVGIEPRLASLGAMVGIVWDARYENIPVNAVRMAGAVLTFAGALLAVWKK